MLSVVIPLFSEEDSLKELHQELVTVLAKINHEIIFVDDGSKDNSLEVLKEIAKKDSSVRIFSFRKNQGKAEAMKIGFEKAKGDLIVTLDADLQDKPSEILNLLKKQKEGWDLVSGWRKNRKDGIFKNISSGFFNFLAHLIWGVNIHDYNCGLKLYDAEAAKSLNLYGGLHRFIPALVAQNGFSVSEVEINHGPRLHGHSKFGLSKLFKDSPDIFTMFFLSRYSERPLHFFGVAGGILLLAGIIISIYLSILHFQGQPIGDRPLLLLGILLIVMGFQVFFTGFLADLLLHTSHGNEDTDKVMIKYKTD